MLQLLVAAAKGGSPIRHCGGEGNKKGARHNDEFPSAMISSQRRVFHCDEIVTVTSLPLQQACHSDEFATAMSSSQR